jgi:hypothetical protein
MRTRILLLCTLAALQSSAQDPAHSSGWVVIPVPDYQALRAKAFPAEPEPEPPPVEATLTRIDYDLRIGGDVAAGQARITADVLRDGWVRVPFPSGLLVREARLDGKLVALTPAVAGKSGSQSVLLSKRGRSVLLLDVAFPVASKAGDQTLRLPTGESGVTRASVTLPRQDVDVGIAGGFLSEKGEAAAETKWIVYGGGQEPLILTWRRKMEDHRSALPLRFRGSLTELLGLGEDSTSIYAEVSLEVLQGAAREVRIQLPDKVTVNQVQGATVADWEMKPGELTVTFLEPCQQTAAFTLAGEVRLPRDGTIDIPLLRLLDVEREAGGVAVEVLGAGEIKDIKSQGLETADAAELGAMVSGRQSPSLAAFRLRPGAPPARSLTVNVARYAQQAVLTANIEEARYRVLMTSEGKTLVQARYAVRNNQRNFVKIGLPAGAVVWSASLSGRPVRPGQAPDGGLLFPLAKTRAGEEAPAFALQVVYLVKGAAWDDKGQSRLALPALDLPASRTGLTLYYPPLFRVTAEPGSFRAQAEMEPSSAVLRAEGVRVPPEAQHRPPNAAAQIEAAQQSNSSAAQLALQSLASNYRATSRGRKDATLLPIAVSFPAVGPSMFLVSELTGENQGPTIDLSYQREKKRGAK